MASLHQIVSSQILMNSPTVLCWVIWCARKNWLCPLLNILHYSLSSIEPIPGLYHTIYDPWKRQCFIPESIFGFFYFELVLGWSFGCNCITCIFAFQPTSFCQISCPFLVAGIQVPSEVFKCIIHWFSEYPEFIKIWCSTDPIWHYFCQKQVLSSVPF